MRSPGRILADWIVDDPRRVTLTPKTDRAFYSALYNVAAGLLIIAAFVVAVAVLT